MNSMPNVMPLKNNTRYFGIAKVLYEETTDGKVQLLWEDQGKQQTVNATVTIYRSVPLKPGKQVLISGESVHQLFVIGLIGKPDSDMLDAQRLKTSNGVSATVSRVDGHETLNVFSSQNELLFSYDATDNITRVEIPQGDLQLVTKAGNIELDSAKSVNIKGQSVNLEGQKLSIHAPYAQMIFGRLESVSDTIIEGAKNVFRTVKELSQVRSGRMRVFVDETYQFKSKKAVIKADEDYKVDAEKIHLG